MRLRVLGCSGGIGGNLRTTSFAVDHDMLIDAGTGVGELSLIELSRIDHIFITHSHMDHICGLPLLLDSVRGLRDRPVNIYATGDTLEILKKHVFNWQIWPDFAVIPNAEEPVMRYREIALGETLDLQGRKITAIPAVHTVPAVGFHLDSGQGSLVFSGDTFINNDLWTVVNRIENLRYLIIETAFSDDEIELARLSKHLCPGLLAAELEKYTGSAQIYITHLKPDEVDLIMGEVSALAGGFNPRMLLNNQEIIF